MTLIAVLPSLIPPPAPTPTARGSARAAAARGAPARLARAADADPRGLVVSIALNAHSAALLQRRGPQSTDPSPWSSRSAPLTLVAAVPLGAAGRVGLVGSAVEWRGYRAGAARARRAAAHRVQPRARRRC
ncbi:hypothetical protein LV779_28105 [Streptomyces thinghirensis]|nr:hypothetical protein [Streptomyces thinghirensis]